MEVGGRGNVECKDRAQKNFRAAKTLSLYDTIMMDIHHYILVQRLYVKREL